MKTHIDLLDELIANGPIKMIDKDSKYSVVVVEEMFNEGLIEAVEHRPHTGVKYLDVKITLAGREWLLGNKTTVKWYHSFQNIIAVIGVLVAIIGVGVAVIA